MIFSSMLDQSNDAFLTEHGRQNHNLDNHRPPCPALDSSTVHTSTFVLKLENNADGLDFPEIPNREGTAPRLRHDLGIAVLDQGGREPRSRPPESSQAPPRAEKRTETARAEIEDTRQKEGMDCVHAFLLVRLESARSSG